MKRIKKIRFENRKAKMKYFCYGCGKEHENWPALTFDSPHFYHILSDEDKGMLAAIDSDFCTI